MSRHSEVPRFRLSRWSDERLCAECLEGNEDAWDALLEKYKQLIYSIPIKYGLSRDEASDIFQEVCLRLLRESPNLRTPKSLAGWLIVVTSRACFKWVGQERRFQSSDFELEQIGGRVSREMPDTWLREFERAQILREALSEIPPRCRELMRMLFFETPAVPYEKVAKKLGIAKGSIGPTRMHCLNRLRRQLEPKGFS